LKEGVVDAGRVEVVFRSGCRVRAYDGREGEGGVICSASSDVSNGKTGMVMVLQYEVYIHSSFGAEKGGDWEAFVLVMWEKCVFDSREVVEEVHVG
jgi:hypothetical protein